MMELRWVVAAMCAFHASAQTAPLRTATFAAYPGYPGPLQVGGSVNLGAVDQTVQVVFAYLTGVDTECQGEQTGAGNVCGIHIHTGDSCSTGTGGHYWDNQGGTVDDPWVPVTYTDPMGDDHHVTIADIVVNTGLTMGNLDGKVFVVHDSKGVRVACAKVAPVTGTSVLKVSSFIKYHGSATDYEVSGTVEVFQSNADEQFLSWSLTGADAVCTPDYKIVDGNACGVHIHMGESCFQPAMGHYWNEPVIGVGVENDPWKYMAYRHAASTGVTVPIRTGFGEAGFNGRTVVIHSATGGRIACGLLTPNGETVPPTPVPTPVPTPPAPTPVPTPAPPTEAPTPAPPAPDRFALVVGAAGVVLLILCIAAGVGMSRWLGQDAAYNEQRDVELS